MNDRERSTGMTPGYARNLFPILIIFKLLHTNHTLELQNSKKKPK
ncbi:hypothetical protein wVul_0180 [Wolbachia endosymbiont of Armadillidium vulgare str. wVulC]|nr:hypothetical protein wVul_0180 [Wolbachia endosymbiont of Armadillidium vulgare str. wVulC]